MLKKVPAHTLVLNNETHNLTYPKAPCATVFDCSCAILILGLTPGAGIRSSYILQRTKGRLYYSKHIMLASSGIKKVSSIKTYTTEAYNKST